MHRFLIIWSCLWHQASSSYCSISVLIMRSHPGSVSDQVMICRQCPGLPPSHAVTPGPHQLSCLLSDNILLSRQHSGPGQCVPVCWRAAKNFFQIFQKKSDHMSHMAERKCFVVDYFYFRLKKSLHIYVSKYLYIVVNVSTTACSTRAVELNTLHEMILFTKSSLIFMLHSSLNHNFKLLTKDFVKFTFQVHKLTKLDKNQCLIRIAWGRESLILMSPIKWIYWLLNNGLCFKSEKWQFNNFPLHRITRYFSYKTYVYTCNNMCLCTFLHKG